MAYYPILPEPPDMEPPDKAEAGRTEVERGIEVNGQIIDYGDRECAARYARRAERKAQQAVSDA